MTLSLTNLRSLTNNRHGVIDVPCPLCGPYAKMPFNRTRKVLRIWDDGRFVTYKCIRCEANGWARDDAAQQSIPKIVQLPEKKDMTEVATRLWALSQEHGLHETYLDSRKCLIASPNLRSLPASGKHPPAMVARFGSGPISGVHLTRLRPDGRGKADIEVPKITLGQTMGQPIIVHEAPKCQHLLIAEGIEDAASLALATGWSAWAAGSAGRIAALMPMTKDYEHVYLSVDQDVAGIKAFDLATKVRGDVIPLLFASGDPNKVLMKHGLETLQRVVRTRERVEV